MKLAGNITVKEGRTDIATVGESNNPQIKVTKSYTLSGVDLTTGVTLSEGDEEDNVVDDLIDQAKREIQQTAESFTPEELGIGGEFVGMSADVSIHGLTLEELKNLEVQLDLTAFYDVPIGKIEESLDELKSTLIGKE